MLGAHLLLRLCRDHEHILASYRKGSSTRQAEHIFELYEDNHEPLWQRVKWVEADLEDAAEVSELLEEVDQLFHCAAMVSFDPLDGPAMLDVNPLITANLVNAGLEHGLSKMVHVSSVAALGRSAERGEINENSHWNSDGDNSVYARSKYRSELEVWRAAAEGLKTAIVNPGIILGPGDWKNGSARLFYSMDNGFRFYTEGVNGFVDVRDVAEIMVQLMDSSISDERFVLVAENKSYQDLFFSIADALKRDRPTVKAQPWMGEIVWRAERLKSFITGKKPLVTPETARTSHQLNRYANQKIRSALDFEFRPMEQTIKELAALYRKDHD